MSKLLIEIGIEELPANQIKSAILHISNMLKKEFETSGIEFDGLEIFATPRRLAIYIDSIADSGPESEKELKGPPKKICFDGDGNPTKALTGFCIKANLKTEDVQFKEFGKSENAFANVVIPGRKLTEIISEELPKIILSFPHPHSMRWDETGVSWVRPIRWIICLKDSEIIPVEIGNVKSDKFTLSPRPEKTKKIEINFPEEYIKTIESMGIVPDYEDRKQFIFSSAEKLANGFGLKIQRDEKLLDELVGIVERPLVVAGEFPKDYIKSTPDLVLRTVLVSDLRFIPFENKNGELSNRFALVINGAENIAETTMRGEMKVLLGKLSDAKFFFEKDRKQKLEDFRVNLSGVAFMKGLGTLQDKTERLKSIATSLAEKIVENPENLVKACSLAKLDLTTSLVREHDELQGKIGGLYASLDGENSEVCGAISQQYLPANETDKIPEGKTAQALSVIDKADSLINLIANGSIPKGSADPLGVRRFAISLLRILIDGEVKIDFEELLTTCSEFAINKSENVVSDSISFISPRLEKLLKNRGHSYDVVSACITPGISNIPVVLERCKALTDVYQTPMFEGIVATTKRLKNILKDWERNEFSSELFSEGTETEFANEASSIFSRIDDGKSISEKIKILAELTDSAEKYFEEILVNAEDEKIRTNRKNFLSWLLFRMKEIADFTAIAI